MSHCPHAHLLRRFIYTTFVAVDANFRLKRRAISNEARDPSMSSGWGYFVEDTGYKAWLNGFTDQQEVRRYNLKDLPYAHVVVLLDVYVHRFIGRRPREHEVPQGLRGDGRGSCSLCKTRVHAP